MPYFETTEARDALSPQQALHYLKEGNARFTSGHPQHRDLMSKLQLTKRGQLPYASILSCMDSRTAIELIFDQGLGNVFSVRVAGNVVDSFVLGSLEYATAAAGTRLVLVLGHTGCGAVAGAIKGVKMGHLTGLLARIQPAVAAERNGRGGEEDEDFASRVSAQNAVLAAEEILAASPIIADLCRQGRLAVVPALYDIATGGVTFYDPVLPPQK